MCLDTFPYTGGTTTYQALWMGVPTLTVAGPTPPGRQGAAILRAGLRARIEHSLLRRPGGGCHGAGERLAHHVAALVRGAAA